MKGMRSDVWSSDTLVRGVGKAASQPSQLLDPKAIADDAELSLVACHSDSS